MNNKFLYWIMESARLFVLVIALFFISCSDKDEKTDTYSKAGVIKFYTEDSEFILQEIAAYDYSNYGKGTLGISYVGYIDKRHMVSDNSVSLFISKDLKLEHVEYVYSEKGSNFGTTYKHYNIENNSASFSYEIQQNGEILEGRFSGELYSGLVDDKIVIDSCLFRLRR